MIIIFLTVITGMMIFYCESESLIFIIIIMTLHNTFSLSRYYLIFALIKLILRNNVKYEFVCVFGRFE